MSKRQARKMRHRVEADPLGALRSLRTHALPHAVRQGLLALGEAVVPELLAIVEALLNAREAEGKEASLARARATPQSLATLEAAAIRDGQRWKAQLGTMIALHRDGADEWPAAHAATVLADLRGPSSVPSLLHALVRSTDAAQILHDRLIRDLPRFGGALCGPGLEALLNMHDVDARLDGPSDDERSIAARARGDLCAVLVEAGVRDERLLAILWEHARENPELYEEELAQYGDPAVRPAILAEIQRRMTEPLADVEQPYNELARYVFPLGHVYEALGGALPDEVDGALRELDAKVVTEFHGKSP